MKWVVLRQTRDMIALDTIPSLDGGYRLVGKDRESCERIDRPGHLGYEKHDETCSALDRPR